MRTHDPTWEPDPTMKYSFKAKKQKVSDEADDLELEESVRTISALFSQGANDIAPQSTESSGSDEPLEARVASISAEIAAAIAQASSRALDADDDEIEEEGVEEEDGEGWSTGSGHEIGGAESIVSNTSGIRGNGVGGKGIRCVEEDEEDSDTFPIPLRTRKGKEPVSLVGIKRKR